jgi:hypothetical protein
VEINWGRFYVYFVLFSLVSNFSILILMSVFPALKKYLFSFLFTLGYIVVLIIYLC